MDHILHEMCIQTKLIYKLDMFPKPVRRKNLIILCFLDKTSLNTGPSPDLPSLELSKVRKSAAWPNERLASICDAKRRANGHDRTDRVPLAERCWEKVRKRTHGVLEGV